MSKGTYKWINDTTVEVTELPIGTWTDDYKEHLINMCSNGSKFIKDFESYYTAKNVNFKLKMAPGMRAELENTFETEFKLTSTKNLSLNNIHLFSSQGAIRKFKDSVEVLKAWAIVRIRKYLERKNHQLKEMRHDLKFLSAKVRFIQDIIDGKIILNNKKLEDVVRQLTDADYPLASQSDVDDVGGAGGYAYLTRMPLYQLTAEKKESLEKEARSLEQKIVDLENKSIHNIWLEELQEFEDAWDAHRIEIEKDYADDGNGKPIGAKGASGKGRKTGVAAKK